jgi:hypothetical protein
VTTVFHAVPCDEAINYVWALTRRPYIARWMDDPSPAGFVRFVDDWRRDALTVYFVTHKETPIGMIHLVPSGTALVAHIAFDRTGWGQAETAARMVREICGDNYVEAFIPAKNHRAVGLARRIGKELGSSVIDGEECIHFEIERKSCHHKQYKQ